MSFVPAQELDKTAFGELAVSEPTPIAQIYAANGLRENLQQRTRGTGAQITEVDSNFIIESGTDSDGFASLLTLQDCKYRSGQGLLCRFTALWESNEADSLQGAGFINDSQCFIFGYNGTSFGIARIHGGVSEFQELTVTTPAGGSENATITVDGVGYTVPLTSGTTQHNAWEIANSLEAQVPLYNFTSNGSNVRAIDELARPAGAFAFSSATAVASWSQIRSGVTPIEDWVPQANWSNPPNFTIDPTKGNVFQIRIQYLGYGGIRFYMENPDTAVIDLVHIYDYANQNIIPTVEDPTFKVGWSILNRGNTANLVMRGATAAVFNEGEIKFDERSRSIAVSVTGIGTTPINLITIRNRIDYDSKVNRITSYPLALIVSADHNKPVIFHIHSNSTFVGDLIYSYVDEVNSITEQALQNITSNLDGRDLGTVQTRSTAPFQLDIANVVQYLLPGEYLSIIAQTASGSGAEADATLYWIEDQ